MRGESGVVRQIPLKQRWELWKPLAFLQFPNVKIAKNEGDGLLNLFF